MAVSTDLLAGFVVFAVVTLFTPGPNNVMLLASGLNFGFRRALPHLLGVTIGFSAMVFIVGIGLGGVLAAHPAIHTVIKHAGAAYLLYLAWVIARSGPVDEGQGGRGRPITFLEAAAFQWVNPKAWVMVVGAIATYAGIAGYPQNMIVIAAVFFVFGVASSGTWVMFGLGLGRVLKSPRSIRIVNIAMALLLVASLVPVVAGS